MGGYSFLQSLRFSLKWAKPLIGWSLQPIKGFDPSGESRKSGLVHDLRMLLTAVQQEDNSL